MSEIVVITLDILSVRELEEIVLEGDEKRALKFLTRVVKPQLESSSKKNCSFFEEEAEPDPFFNQ